MDEGYQTSRRYAAFNVDELCKITSLHSIQSPVSSIDKLEGGFNKALMMRMENGEWRMEKRWSSRYPFRNQYLYTVRRNQRRPSSITVRVQGPPKACPMLKLSVRSHTSIPVPNVLAWNSDPSNAVEAEYLILEKVAGKQLNEVWDEMTGRQRFQLVTRLAHFDAELSQIHFPAYGSLYHRSAATENRIALSLNIDPANEYCVGPVARPITGTSINRNGAEPNNLSGPCMSLDSSPSTSRLLTC